MKFNLLAATLIALGFNHAVSAMPFDPLIGTWQVINDRTGYYVSDIVIRKNSKTQQYNAVIVKMHAQTGSATPTTCQNCQGLLKYQPLFGMETLNNLKATSELHFNQGVWLNTQDGVSYNIQATLSTTKNQMKVSGKSQSSNQTLSMTWLRLQNEE